MAEYLEAVEDEFDYYNDWLEIIPTAGAQPGSGFHATMDVQEDTLVGYVPFNKRRTASRYFLGYAYNDDAPDYNLRREQPHRHPVFPWLYAYDVSFAGIVVQPNSENTSNQPYKDSPFAVDYLDRYADYKLAICTVRYRSYKCRFLPDSEIPSADFEWRRNCLFRGSGRLDTLSIDNINQLKWAETSAESSSGADDAGPPNTVPGSTIGMPLVILQPKMSFEMEWLWVPFLHMSSDPDFFLPDKLQRCVGKVNSVDFLDGLFPAYTCLMQPYEYTEFNFPVASDDYNTGRPIRGVNVRIRFDFFEPEQGATLPGAAGHVTFPWRKNGKYYLCTRNGAPDGKKFLEEEDFNRIWENVNVT
jgi:hypothetical protein